MSRLFWRKLPRLWDRLRTFCDVRARRMAFNRLRVDLCSFDPILASSPARTCSSPPTCLNHKAEVGSRLPPSSWHDSGDDIHLGSKPSFDSAEVKLPILLVSLPSVRLLSSVLLLLLLSSSEAALYRLPLVSAPGPVSPFRRPVFLPSVFLPWTPYFCVALHFFSSYLPFLLFAL